MDFTYNIVESKEEKLEIYNELEAQGLLQILMYGVKEPSFDIFYQFTCMGKTLVVKQGNKFVSLFMVAPEHNKSGQFHFCCARAYFSVFTQVAKKALAMFFTQFGFESFYAFTPKCYFHVFEKAKEVGFATHLAEIKGYCYFARQNKFRPAILSTIHKEDILGA